MRTNKFFKTGLLLFVASLGLISCGDDDKEPEIVVDPVSENVEYYIEGKVVADNAPHWKESALQQERLPQPQTKTVNIH